MVNTASVSGRRTLSFTTLDEFLRDAEALAAGGRRTLGNWTFGQILGHLAYAMHNSMDGFPFQAPWVLRHLVAPFVKNSALTKPLKPGVKLPKSAAEYMPSESLTVEEALANCRRAVERLGNEIPSAKHPFFGTMASEEWMALHLRHAELHMSFVVPDEVAAEPAE
jgi:hypothetical protein